MNSVRGTKIIVSQLGIKKVREYVDVLNLSKIKNNSDLVFQVNQIIEKEPKNIEVTNDFLEKQFKQKNSSTMIIYQHNKSTKSYKKMDVIQLNPTKDDIARTINVFVSPNNHTPGIDLKLKEKRMMFIDDLDSNENITKAELKEEIRELRKVIGKFDSKLKEVANALKEEKIEHSKTKLELKKLQNEHFELKIKYSKLDMKHENLDLKFQKQKQELVTLTDAFIERGEVLKKQKININHKKKEIKTLRMKIKQKEDKIKELQSIEIENEKEKDKKEAEVHQLQKKVEKYKKEIEKILKNKKKMEELEEQEKQLIVRKRELEELETKFNERVKEFDLKYSEIYKYDAIFKDVQEKERKNEDYGRIFDEYFKEIDSLLLKDSRT